MRYAVIPLIVLGMWTQSVQGSPPLELSIQGQHCKSVVAHEVPLADLAHQLATAAGFRLYMAVFSSEEVVSLQLTDIPIEALIRRILADHDTVFVYSITHPDTLVAVYDYGPQGHGGSAGERRLIEQPPESEQRDTLSKSAENVERAETLLRSNPGMLRPDVPVPSELLTDPDPEVRITALQWSVGRGEAFTDALTQALVDEDSRVQSAARELLLQHGIEDQVVAGVTAEAEFDDPIRVRSLVAALLGRAASPAR